MKHDIVKSKSLAVTYETGCTVQRWTCFRDTIHHCQRIVAPMIKPLYKLSQEIQMTLYGNKKFKKKLDRPKTSTCTVLINGVTRQHIQ